MWQLLRSDTDLVLMVGDAEDSEGRVDGLGGRRVKLDRLLSYVTVHKIQDIFYRIRVVLSQLNFCMFYGSFAMT